LWAVGSIVGAVGGGWVSDRFGRKVTLLGCGMLAAVAGYVLFAVPIPYVAACVVNLLFGLFIAPMWVIPIAMAQDAVDPAHIGMTTGLVQIAEGVSGILAPPIFGLLMESLSIGKMLAVGVVGSYGLFALLILVVRETRRKAATGRDQPWRR
jgi:MFS family permease